jgi:hypothetical protein
MANDHYVSRFHTAPWQAPDGNLHFYDYSSGAFGKRHAKALFARALSANVSETA